MLNLTKNLIEKELICNPRKHEFEVFPVADAVDKAKFKRFFAEIKAEHGV